MKIDVKYTHLKKMLNGPLAVTGSRIHSTIIQTDNAMSGEKCSAQRLTSRCFARNSSKPESFILSFKKHGVFWREQQQKGAAFAAPYVVSSTDF